MTIQPRSHRLSLSTDPVASSVHATFRAAQPSRGRHEAVTGAAPLQHADLARLYPSVYGAPAPARIGRIAQALSAVARVLHVQKA